MRETLRARIGRFRVESGDDLKRVRLADEGRIEASDTTLWFGFVDDVVIRVTLVDKGSRVDIRSKSRVGGGDVGINAKRIRKFLAALTGG